MTNVAFHQVSRVEIIRDQAENGTHWTTFKIYYKDRTGNDEVTVFGSGHALNYVPVIDTGEEIK